MHPFVRWFLVPFLVVFLGAAAAIGFVRFRPVPQPPGEIPVVGFDALDLASPWVTLEGTAHYASVITQKVPGSLFSEPQTLHLFGFFPRDASEERAIPVLVRTSRPPERLVHYEYLTVTGRLTALTKDKVPLTTETMLSERTEYFFADEVLLLEPIRIESEDGVFEEAAR